MSKVRIEWIVLQQASAVSGLTMIPAKQIGDAETVTTPLGANLPTAPAGATHARVLMLSGASIIDAGLDPKATQTRGLWYREGDLDAIPVGKGHKLSIVEAQ